MMPDILKQVSPIEKVIPVVITRNGNIYPRGITTNGLTREISLPQAEEPTPNYFSPEYRPLAGTR